MKRRTSIGTAGSSGLTICIIGLAGWFGLASYLDSRHGAEAALQASNLEAGTLVVFVACILVGGCLGLLGAARRRRGALHGAFAFALLLLWLVGVFLRARSMGG